MNSHNYQGLNTKDVFGETGFMIACIFESELAEIVFERSNIELNTQDNMGNTGFKMACIHQPQLVKIMLNNKKVDKNLKNQDGFTGYDLAKKENSESFEIYQSWLEQKNINSHVQKK